MGPRLVGSAKVVLASHQVRADPIVISINYPTCSVIHEPTMQHVTPNTIADSLTELWSPRVVTEFDDSFVKVAKVHGSLAWHSHDHEDELFMVLKGHLRIEMDEGTVELSAGDVYVVPKGVRHNPVADDECHIMLIEKKSTLHTGNVTTDQTRSLEEQLRPV
jgi:mannose-6-phosphate isomerase-like protein (cupin superfamily)